MIILAVAFVPCTVSSGDSRSELTSRRTDKTNDPTRGRSDVSATELPALSCPTGMVTVPNDQTGFGLARWGAGTHARHSRAPSRQRSPPSPFCLDITEVRVADYAACIARGECTELETYSNDWLRPYLALCNWKRALRIEASIL